MAKKAKRKNDKNNNLMMWVFVVLFLLIVISIAVILTLNNGSDPNINSKFFVSDDSKYVVTSSVEGSGENGEPVSAYDVYFYNDNTITDHKAYYEFVDTKAAEKALPQYQVLQGDDVASVEQNGRFIVLTATREQYDGFTMDLIRQLNEAESSDDDSAEDVDAIEVETN